MPEPPKKACCTPSPSGLVASATSQTPANSPTPSGSVAPRLQSAVDQHAAHLQSIDHAPLTQPADPITHADTGSTDNMILVTEGDFAMGTEDPEGFPDDGEGPIRTVSTHAYYIDATAVTNAQFAAFIADTGYITEAQRFGWSFVFHLHLSKKYADKLRAAANVPGLRWWVAVPGAQWDKPHGQRSDLKGLDDHPVVHVSWSDAIAYCQWAGKRLPTEAEWERAARADKHQSIYPWGDQLEPRGKHRCNVWQGHFPDHNSADDGYTATCPVDAYTPNAWGLHNVSGNVWEWTNDWWSPTHHQTNSPTTRQNPRGPQPDQHPGQTFTHKVQKGGSYLCHRSYCNRYRLGARTANTPDSATTNNGFRCARDV